MKKKPNSIFVDLRNEDQVNWWNNKARRLCHVTCAREMLERETGQKVGIVMKIGGPFKRKIIKENNVFIKGPHVLKEVPLKD